MGFRIKNLGKLNKTVLFLSPKKKKNVLKYFHVLSFNLKIILKQWWAVLITGKLIKYQMFNFTEWKQKKLFLPKEEAKQILYINKPPNTILI